jgi:hypothetical protein
MDDRKLSDLKLERKECSRCGATWLNGVHHWKTGYKGNELDLAGLFVIKLTILCASTPKKGALEGTPGLSELSF